MPAERSAGAVIFRTSKKNREYLLLQHPDAVNLRAGKSARRGHWDFPKGHLETGENAQGAALREIREETGLKRVAFISGFKKTIRYFVVYDKGARRLKFVAFFLARAAAGARVKVSREHQAYAWLAYRAARARLTYANNKRVLEQAEKFLRLRAI